MSEYSVVPCFMAKVIPKKAATLEQLGRAEKEMTHLGARVQELRRQVRSASAPSSKVLTGADIKEFCRQRNLTQLSRLFAALGELVPTAQIGSWLETSNSAFEGSTPVQVIERGESDR